MANETHRPFFSVCMPTYNYAHYIGEAIESVLGQDFQDFELIICDDCSTDDTEAVVRRYNDSRVRYCRNTDRLGIFGNLNKTMDMATGEYLKTLCADDALSPACLGVLHRAILAQASRPTLVNVRMIDDQASLARNVAGCGPYRSSNPQTAMAMFNRREELYWNLPSLCVRRDYFRDLGYFRSKGKDRDYALDVTVTLGMLTREPALLIDSPLVFARRHGKNAAFRLSRLIASEEILAFLRENRAAHHALPGGAEATARIAEEMVIEDIKYGVGAILLRGNPRYLREAFRMLRRQDYGPVPWAKVIAYTGRAALKRVTGRNQ